MASNTSNHEEEIESIKKVGVSLKVALIAMTAALYTALGYIFQPISFLGLQFRVAELIVGMCIIFPIEGLIGKILGVFFVNLNSPFGAIDLISCIINIPALYCIILFRDKKFLKYLGGVLYSIIISIYVAIIIFVSLGVPIWLNLLYIFISEVILATLGIFMFDVIKRRFNLDYY